VEDLENLERMVPTCLPTIIVEKLQKRVKEIKGMQTRGFGKIKMEATSSIGGTTEKVVTRGPLYPFCISH